MKTTQKKQEEKRLFLFLFYSDHINKQIRTLGTQQQHSIITATQESET